MAMGDAPCCSREAEPDNRWNRAFKKLAKAFSCEYKLHRQRRASHSEEDYKPHHKSSSCSSLTAASATPETRQGQSKSRRHSNDSFSVAPMTYVPVCSSTTPSKQLPGQGNAAIVDLFTNALTAAAGNLQHSCSGVPADEVLTVVRPDYSKPQHGGPFQHPGLAQLAADGAEPAAAWSLTLSSTVDDNCNPQQGDPSQHLDSAKPAAGAAAPGAVTAFSPALGSALDDHEMTVDQRGCTPPWTTDAEAKDSNVVTAQQMYQAGKTADAANMPPLWIQELVLAAQREKISPAEAPVTFGCGARLCDLGGELDSLAKLPLINPYERQAAAAARDGALHNNGKVPVGWSQPCHFQWSFCE